MKKMSHSVRLVRTPFLPATPSTDVTITIATTDLTIFANPAGDEVNIYLEREGSRFEGFCFRSHKCPFRQRVTWLSQLFLVVEIR